MSDWSDEEYRSILTYKPMPEEDKIFDDQPEDNGVSNGIDWRSSGAVNSIKNQGSCGSCWAFSTVAAMEAAHKIASGSLLNLSEQQLVDCDTGNGACQGGLQTKAFNYYKSYAAMSTSSYPYRGVKGTCRYSTTNTGVKAKGYTQLTANSATAMKSAL